MEETHIYIYIYIYINIYILHECMEKKIEEIIKETRNTELKECRQKMHNEENENHNVAMGENKKWWMNSRQVVTLI